MFTRYISRLSGMSEPSKRSSIKALLIDLSGTLHIDDETTPGAVNALEKLRSSNVELRFVTNTTKESSQTLFNRLIKLGFKIDKNEIFSSLSAAVNYVEKYKLTPFYLLSQDARKDFPTIPSNVTENAVVVGLAPDEFHYKNLNKAFNILLKECPLIAIHEGKYYRNKDGLAIGPGCFTKGLEFAASTQAIIVGKPNKYFFESAIPSGIKAEECIMIGDDPRDDIEGAMNIGMKGILVKTGKYTPDIIMGIPPTLILENFAAVVDWLIEHNFEI